MRSRDLVAFTLLFVVANGLLFFVGYLWIKEVGWNYLWLLALALIVIALFIGFTFAKYAFAPLLAQQNELERLLKDTLHELNIPVATIKANLILLRKRIDEKKSLERLERIEKAVDQLLRLYKELDYEIKKEIGNVEAEEFDLCRVVKERVDFFKDLTAQKTINIECKECSVFLPLMGVVKVIDNLLSNAIKYTSKNGVIKIYLKDKKLSIIDNGIGMDEGELLRVFDRFYRADTQKEGYGIGLSIVKDFCDRYGIVTKIESQKGKGTKIELDFSKVCK